MLNTLIYLYINLIYKCKLITGESNMKLNRKEISKFILSCLLTTIMTCIFIMIPPFIFASFSNKDEAIETSAKVIDEASIKFELQKDMESKLKDNISIFLLKDCFKKTYYIGHNGVKMYKSIGDEDSLIRCLDINDEVVAYQEKDGYIYCDDNFSNKGWIKKSSEDLISMPLNTSQYRIDVNLTSQVINIYNNGNLIRKNIICSTGALGNSDTETPIGIFKIKKKLFYPNGLDINNRDGTKEKVMYPIQFFSNYLIHSVPINQVMHNNKVEENINEKLKLGKPVSHGCIRVDVADAKWIYNNMPQDAEVYIHY